MVSERVFSVFPVHVVLFMLLFCHDSSAARDRVRYYALAYYLHVLKHNVSGCTAFISGCTAVCLYFIFSDSYKSCMAIHFSSSSVYVEMAPCFVYLSLVGTSSFT